MSYNVDNLAKLAALKELGLKQKKVDDAQNSRIKALEDVGAQANVIEAVKVNGTAQAVSNKAVDIKVPTKVSDLSNDSKFQSDTEVSAAIQTAISKSGHASFQKVDSVPSASTAKENILYLVMNAKTGHYDIYAKVGDSVELLDDTTVDLSGYVTKETGKGLSANDFTTALLNKLNGIEDGANKYVHATHDAHASGFYKVTVDGEGHVTAAVPVSKADITALGIPAQDTTYSVATQTANGLMSSTDKKKVDGIADGATKVEASTTAGNIKVNGTETPVVSIATDDEVAEMLAEIYGE